MLNFNLAFQIGAKDNASSHQIIQMNYAIIMQSKLGKQERQTNYSKMWTSTKSVFQMHYKQSNPSKIKLRHLI